ncbi:LOW QUALITY PROTEIN: cell division cycle-associated protein 2 [Eleginops maclovinus]|uniref:LOW QUALITY PROTEIN: cell division cycle-associated protein 2 n=1 Tax=Eleginops maclovinus TaxID=56733 RepID=UPI00308002C4
MASLEMNTASTDGDQENMLIPSKVDSHPVLNDTNAPMNFTDLTPCRFGISVQSFSQASSPNRKDKSRLAQIKARRRSSVGVRGSPETNSLICFMAQQRMKTPPVSQTPEPVRSGPLLPRVASKLRQKMASFQGLMDVEESEVCDPVPKQDGNTGGCIKTRDYLSDGYSPYEGKENHPLMTTPVPSKRRRLGRLQGCETEIRAAPIQEEEKETGTLTSSETVQEAHAVLKSLNLQDDFETQACSNAQNLQDEVFELQSPGQTPPDDAAAASSALPASPFCIPSLPSVQEMKPPGEHAFKKKKKSVRFGCPLSPEIFDKELPPITPLRKGATPSRAPTPGRSLLPRSVLKTPQRIEPNTTNSAGPQQPRGLRSLADIFHTSQPQNVFDWRRPPGGGRKDCFPCNGDIDAAATEDTESRLDPQPLNLNSAFRAESLSRSLSEIVASPCTPSLIRAVDEPPSVPEEEKVPEAEAETPTGSRNRRKKQPAANPAASIEAPSPSSRRKRKQPGEMEPIRRTLRSSAKSVLEKIKTRNSATWRWNKDVDHSLYSHREYASQNPKLSPITEKLSPIRLTPAAQQTPSSSCTAPNQETHLNPEISNNTQVDPTVTNVLENPSEDALTSPASSTESSTGKSRKPSVMRGKRSGKKKKVSLAEDFLLIHETGGTTEVLCEDKHTTNQEASWETPRPEEEVDAEQSLHSSADTPCTVSEGKLENDGSVNTPDSESLPAREEPPKTLPVRRKSSQGRTCSGNISVVQEQAEQQQSSQKVEVREQESSSRSSSDSHVKRTAPLNLAPWQDDFNFEDVFLPVASRGLREVREVRRSLRNHSAVKNNASPAGLAWFPHTSPETLKETRRRTRIRRLRSVPAL